MANKDFNRPIFGVVLAAKIWIVSALFVAFLGRLAISYGQEVFIKSLLLAYGTHFLLAVILVAKRLPIYLPVDRKWLDPIVVITAPWLGPIFYYFLWKRRSGEPGTTDNGKA